MVKISTILDIIYDGDTVTLSGIIFHVILSHYILNSFEYYVNCDFLQLMDASKIFNSDIFTLDSSSLYFNFNDIPMPDIMRENIMNKGTFNIKDSKVFSFTHLKIDGHNVYFCQNGWNTTALYIEWNEEHLIKSGYPISNKNYFAISPTSSALRESFIHDFSTIKLNNYVQYKIK